MTINEHPAVKEAQARADELKAVYQDIKTRNQAAAAEMKQQEEAAHTAWKRQCGEIVAVAESLRKNPSG